MAEDETAVAPSATEAPESAPVDTSTDESKATLPTDGSEAENNTGKEAMVPSHRVREATEARRQAEERAEQAERELEELRQQQTQVKTESADDDVDDDVLNLVKKSAVKLGFVSKEELEARDRQAQYQNDVRDLTETYANSSVPFVEKEVREFAKKEGISITSKASLRAAYKLANEDKILEAERNAAIAEFKEGKSVAEKPGKSGDKKPEESQARGTKARIQEAFSKIK